MKNIFFGILPIVAITIFAFTVVKPGEDIKTLEIGEAAPMADAKMMGTDGEKYNLASLKKDNGLIVIFSCNTCPFVIQWEDRYNQIHEQAEGGNIGTVLINSNEAKRAGDDSMAEMKNHAKEMGYKSPYLLDENHKLADAFGARTTPHVFVFDGEMNLVYRGAIDDNGKDASAVKSPYLTSAIRHIQSGMKPDPNETKAIGCSIKRVKA